MTRAAPIYIFGAGTSKCAGAPLMHEFAEMAFRQERKPPSPRHPPPSWQGAQDAMNRAIAQWREKSPNANVEAHYVLMELLHNLERSNESEQRLTDLQFLIAETLRFAIGQGVSQDHNNLVNTFWSRWAGQPKPRIITLNWDITLETAVRTNAKVRGAPVIDYGLGKIVCGFHAPEDAKDVDRLRIYKLHGSMNWILCFTCGVVASEAKIDQPLDVVCSNCGRFGKRLFVPPTSQKLNNEQEPQIAELWKSARLELQNCKELAIVGYSLPRTDVQFQMFLTESLAKNEALETICVVSEPKFGTAKAAFEDHFSSAFRGGPHHHKLRFRYLRFEEWVKDECRLFEAARVG